MTPAGQVSASESLARIMLRQLPGVGDLRFATLFEEFKSGEAALAAIRSRRANVSDAAWAALKRGAVEAEALRILERCDRFGIEIRHVGTTRYPERVHHPNDRPAMLFVRGNAELLFQEPAVAIVGARQATAVGRRMAERLGRELSEAGVTVVSGMALGIDAAAHRGALHGSGGTVAVLGRGPERAYPLQNAELFHRVAEIGCLVSEFPPETVALPSNFPRRNRIIAALAKAVVVVEASAKSGAMITVNHALELGREVCAVPGSVESAVAEAPNRLIQAGAHAVLDVSHVLAVIDWETVPTSRTSTQGDLWGAEAPGGGKAERLFRKIRMGGAPLALDGILEGTDLSPGEALGLLAHLELEGRIRREPEGWYVTSGTSGSWRE